MPNSWDNASALFWGVVSAISSGGLAQLVELLPRKQRVNGSIPLTSTIETTKKLRRQLFAFLGPAFCPILPSFQAAGRALPAPFFFPLLALAKAGFFAHNKAISWPELGRAD